MSISSEEKRLIAVKNSSKRFDVPEEQPRAVVF